MFTGGIYNGVPFTGGFSRRYISKQFSYFLQPFAGLDPAYDLPFDVYTDYPLPVTLAEAKTYLRIDPLVTADDELITSLITVAAAYGEQETKRDFITKRYLTYRDCFNDNLFTLRKSKLQEIISFQYLVNGTFIDVPAVYYNTDDFDYSSIVLSDGQAWPNNIDYRLQAIKIVFDAGYGNLPSDVPAELKLAIKQHILQMYENRGDCSAGTGANDCGSSLPMTARLIYNKFRITDLNTVPY